MNIFGIGTTLRYRVQAIEPLDLHPFEVSGIMKQSYLSPAAEEPGGYRAHTFRSHVLSLRVANGLPFEV